MLDHFSGQNFIMGVYTWTPVVSYRENGGGQRLTKNWDFNTVGFEEKSSQPRSRQDETHQNRLGSNILKGTDQFWFENLHLCGWMASIQSNLSFKS